VLDIARAPLLRRQQGDIVSVARRLAGRGDVLRRVWLLLTDVAAQEIEGKLEQVHNECARAVERLAQDLAALRQVERALGRRRDISEPVAIARDVPAELRDLAQSLRQDCLVLESDDETRAAAGQRVTSRRRPAREGRDNYPDCEILESCFRFADRLGGSSFRPGIWFVSSN